MNEKQELPVNTDKEAIERLLTRGVDEVIGGDELRARLLSGERLRIKLGIDPTSPHMHLGRSVPLLKMRDFQEMGHTAVLIVGDFTGVIGDTSDKESERPMLTDEQIEVNKQEYFTQIGTLVDITKAELHYNASWLGKLTYKEICEQANHFSVAEFIARDNIKKRLDSGKRVSLRETLYPLMQGYDSVAIKADVELGGVDQRFNLLAGRTLQPAYQQKPQALVVTSFPIEGLDGRKMSSSWGNTINFTDEPADMFGKVMSLTDALIERYATILTRLSLEEISMLKTMHPKDAKMKLAFELVRMYHSQEAAQSAQEKWTHTFAEGGVPEDILTISIERNTSLIDALVASGEVSSKTEARRLLEAGAVSHIDSGEKVSLEDRVEETVTLRVGKKRFIRFEVA